MNYRDPLEGATPNFRGVEGVEEGVKIVPSTTTLVAPSPPEIGCCPLQGVSVVHKQCPWVLRSTNESLYTLFEDLGKSSVGTLKTVNFWHTCTYHPSPGGGRDFEIRLFTCIFDELSNGVSFMGVTILVSEKNGGGRF